MIRSHHQFMWSFTGSFLRSLKRPVFIYLSTLAITMQFIFAFAFYQFENPQNEAISSYFDSLYFTVTVMTGVGLGDIYPLTIAGRVIAMLMMLSGTVIFVSFTGTLAASILQVESEHVLQKK